MGKAILRNDQANDTAREIAKRDKKKCAKFKSPKTQKMFGLIHEKTEYYFDTKKIRRTFINRNKIKNPKLIR